MQLLLMRSDRDRNDSHDEHESAVLEWAGETLARHRDHFCSIEALVSSAGYYSFKPHSLNKANWLLGIFAFKVVVLEGARTKKMLFSLPSWKPLADSKVLCKEV